MGTTAQLIPSLRQQAPDERQWIHATALSYQGIGLLFLGAPRSGKSSLALACLHQGFALIADDAAILYSDERHPIWVQGCADTRGLLHTYPQGLLDVNTQIGVDSVIDCAPLEIVFTLDDNSHPLNAKSGLLRHPALKKQHLPHRETAQRLKSVLQFMQQHDSARRSGKL